MTVEKLNEWRDAWKKPVKIRFRKVKFRELVKTREGELFAYPDKDYMIEGIDGEQYPIKKDIFDKTYTLTNEVESLEAEVNELKEESRKLVELISANLRYKGELESRLAKAQGILKEIGQPIICNVDWDKPQRRGVCFSIELWNKLEKAIKSMGVVGGDE